MLLVALIAIPAPAFYAAFEPFSDNQHQAFRLLQFGLVAPTLMFAASLIARARALRPPAGWPWRDPAFFALATSLALFALGGVMGLMISGSDTRTPAHYHAVITAVSVSSAGMLLTFGLSELGRLPAPARATRVLIGLYGGGQFVASIGMFVAGGYGAARKTPTGVGSLDAVAAAGMAVHRDRLHFHDCRRRGLRRDRDPGRRRGLRRDRDPGALEDGARGIRARAVRRNRCSAEHEVGWLRRGFASRSG